MTFPKPKMLMRGFLASVLVGAFMIALLWTFQFPIPASNEQFVTFMLGQLSGMVVMAVAYYFGTSQSTADQHEAWRSGRDDDRFSGMDDPRPFVPGRDLPPSENIEGERP